MSPARKRWQRWVPERRCSSWKSWNPDRYAAQRLENVGKTGQRMVRKCKEQHFTKHPGNFRTHDSYSNISSWKIASKGSSYLSFPCFPTDSEGTGEVKRSKSTSTSFPSAACHPHFWISVPQLCNSSCFHGCHGCHGLSQAPASYFARQEPFEKTKSCCSQPVSNHQKLLFANFWGWKRRP